MLRQKDRLMTYVVKDKFRELVIKAVSYRHAAKKFVKQVRGSDYFSQCYGRLIGHWLVEVREYDDPPKFFQKILVNPDFV